MKNKNESMKKKRAATPVNTVEAKKLDTSTYEPAKKDRHSGGKTRTAGSGNTVSKNSISASGKASSGTKSGTTVVGYDNSSAIKKSVLGTETVAGSGYRTSAKRSANAKRSASTNLTTKYKEAVARTGKESLASSYAESRRKKEKYNSK